MQESGGNMKVGIIVYSQTGNTMSVAQKLEEAMNKAGHAATILRVEALNETAPYQLKSAPEVALFDTIVFASPVQAFSLAPVMKLYLSQISSLTDKKMYCFVTQHLKKAWLGGNHALRQIAQACKLKDAEVAWSGVVNWSSELREKQIDEIVNKIMSSM